MTLSIRICCRGRHRDPSDEQAHLAMSDTDYPTCEVRKIIHVDMDAFYVPLEQRDNPETDCRWQLPQTWRRRGGHL
jgi:hypothetical protein